MLQLYSNIKSRRLYLEMTQTELAHKMGYADKSMIAKIEKGQVDLPQSKIMAFADVLGVSPGELMGLDGIDKGAAAPSTAAALPSPAQDTLTVSGLEKEIIVEYRAADSISKAMVLKALDIDLDKDVRKEAEQLKKSNHTYDYRMPDLSMVAEDTVPYNTSSSN